MITRMLSTPKRTLYRPRKRRSYRLYALWVLAVAIMVTYGLGLGRHIHVPQVSALATDHTHAAEVHFGTATGIIDNAPNDHPDAVWVMLDLDGQSITKKTPGADFALILFGALVVLYALRPSHGRRIPLPAVARPKQKSFYSICPPSHAPPR